MKATIFATPPSTGAGPSAATSSSAASTPFWNGTTQVSGPSSGRMVLDGLGGLPGLHAEQHGIHRPDLRRIVGGPLRPEHGVSARRLDREARGAERVELGAPGDEHHVLARLHEARAEIAADARRRR